MKNKRVIEVIDQGQGLLIAVVLGGSNDSEDPKRKEDDNATSSESDQPIPDDEEAIQEQVKQEEKRENIGPDNAEWQEDQRKEDPHRAERLRDKPQVERINKPRDSI